MIEFKISNRLLSCAELITPGAKIADIGTDHAYIPIWLSINKKISHALACDIRTGPLENAKKNIKHFRMEKIIKTRLSDGLESINSEEADEIIIAGMGGNMISNILERCSWKNKYEKKFILQPMKYENKLRSYLASKGYEIKSEKAIICAEKIYTVMTAIFTGIPYKISTLEKYIGKIHEHITPESELYIKKQIKNIKNMEKGAIAKKNLIEKAKYETTIEQLESILKLKSKMDGKK